jgi:TetR/AcrR family transcriptional repressor of nem operon
VSKGDQTRRRIVEKTGGLFNRFGYRATPMSAVMRVTGLKKGGLYNHFRSKKDLAIATFRFNVSSMSSFLTAATIGVADPVRQLRLLLAASTGIASGDVVPGGCPVLNAAVESDDAFPALRKEVALGAEELRGKIRLLLQQAREAGRIQAEADPEGLSHFILASVEGGIMLSKLHGASLPLETVLGGLNRMIDTLEKGAE